MSNLIIIMGVSGCGKTTVSRALANRQAWPLLEADDFHPQANISKMAAGTPLTDADRKDWVEALCEAVNTSEEKAPIILSCSALTEFVQEKLSDGVDRMIIWIWLHGSHDLIARRLAKRTDHFMPEHLLASQFEALTPPEEAVKIDIDQSVDAIVSDITAKLSS